jgi:Fe-S-cluster containining protein
MNFPIIEQSYHFECTRCGNCCTGDQKVNLNPYDLFKMARYKGYRHSILLFENKLVYLVQNENNVWIPQIKFKSIAKKKHRFCPFLINELDENNRLLGLCSLHPEHKPLICSMAPVGRVIDFKEKSESFIFVKPAPDCPGVDIEKKNKLSDLQKVLKTELEYEKQFLQILDKASGRQLSERFYIDNIYSFPVYQSFATIFSRIEQSVL